MGGSELVSARSHPRHHLVVQIPDKPLERVLGVDTEALVYVVDASIAQHGAIRAATAAHT